MSNGARNSKKNIVKAIFDYSDMMGPLPEIHFCLMNTSYFLNLESTFQIENSTKIKPAQTYKKKPLFLLNKVKIQTIRTKFERRRNDYLKLLKKYPLLLNSRQSDKQLFAEPSDKQLFAEFEDLFTETVGNPEEIKKLKVNKKFLIQKTNQMFEEATISWHSFLKKRKKFEDQENSNLAARLLETLLRDFKNSDNLEITASTTLTVVKLWERWYTVITNAWLSNFEKECFQRDKVTNKELSFSMYKKTKSVSLDYKDLTNQIREHLIYITSVNSTKKKLQTNNLTEKTIKTKKKEVSSQVSKPLVEALFRSGILKLESVKERKERSLQEGEYLSAEDLKESNYNVVTLNLNEAELSRKVNAYEKSFYKT